MGTIKTTNIQSITGSGTVTLGQSGETITVPSGVIMSGQNYPAFEATMSSNQSVSSAVTTKAQFDSELLDTDNCYDNTTNYRFTPTVAGKYFVYGGVSCFGGAAASIEYVYTYIYKNGSVIKQIHFDCRTNNQRFITPYTSIITTLNGSTDYVEMYGNCSSTSSPSFYSNFSLFGAYRIGS